LPMKPTDSFLLIGCGPAPSKAASMVIGLVMPLIVRLPMILAVLPLATTLVDSKWAVGNWAALNQPADWNSVSSAAMVVWIEAIGTSIETLALLGALGSSVSMPVAPDAMPMFWVKPIWA